MVLARSVVAVAGGIVLGVLFVAPRVSLADGAAAQIEALLAEAKQLDKDGKPADAHEKLLAAWKIEHRYDIAAALGLSEKASGDFAKSAQHLEYAIRFLPDPAKPDRLVGTPWAKPDERQRLIDAFTDVRAKVAAVRLRVVPQGTGVTIDGEKPELLGIDYDVFVMPGTRTVAIAGRAPQTITVESNGSYPVAAEDLPRPHEQAAASTTTPTAVTVSESKPVWPIVVLGTLAAGSAGLGIGMTIVAHNKLNDAGTIAKRSDCTTSPPSAGCVADGSKAVSDHNTFQAIGIAGFVGAGVALSGALLYGLWPKSKVQAAFDPIHHSGFVGLRGAF
jgi:hypothetical protein